MRSLIRQLGFANALLYLAAYVLERVSGGRARLMVYSLMAQPIGSALLRDVSEAASTEVLSIRSDHPQVATFPRPERVIAERFANGANCHLALVKGDFAGFIWLQRDAYMEDEVRCRYVLDEPVHGVWDFDVYVVPKYRLGRTLARLWRAADIELERAGVAWSFSRISAFNAGSRRTHEKLGAVSCGGAVFVVLGGLQVALMSQAPFVHVSTSPRSYPTLHLRPPAIAQSAAISSRHHADSP